MLRRGAADVADVRFSRAVTKESPTFMLRSTPVIPLAPNLGQAGNGIPLSSLISVIIFGVWLN
jgi:hypothetical protein